MEITKTDSQDKKIKVFKREEEQYLFFFIVLSGAWETDIKSYNKKLLRELCERSISLMDENKAIDIIALVDDIVSQIGCVGNGESIRNTLLRETLGLFYVDKTNNCCHFYRIPTSVDISESITYQDNTIRYKDETLISIQFDTPPTVTDSGSEGESGTQTDGGEGGTQTDGGEGKTQTDKKKTKKYKYYLIAILVFVVCVAFVFIIKRCQIDIPDLDNPGPEKPTYQITFNINPEGQISIKGTPDFPDDCIVEYVASMDPGFTLDDGKTPDNSIKYPISIPPYLTRSCTVAVRVWENNEPLSTWLYANYNLEYYIDSLWQDYSKLSYDENRSFDTPTDIAMSRLFDREISYCYIRYNPTVIDTLPVFEVAKFVDNTPMVIDSVKYFSKEIPLFISKIDSFPKIKVVFCHEMN